MATSKDPRAFPGELDRRVAGLGAYERNVCYAPFYVVARLAVLFNEYGPLLTGPANGPSKTFLRYVQRYAAKAPWLTEALARDVRILAEDLFEERVVEDRFACVYFGGTFAAILGHLFATVVVPAFVHDRWKELYRSDEERDRWVTPRVRDVLDRCRPPRSRLLVFDTRRPRPAAVLTCRHPKQSPYPSEIPVFARMLFPNEVLAAGGPEEEVETLLVCDHPPGLSDEELEPHRWAVRDGRCACCAGTRDASVEAEAPSALLSFSCAARRRDCDGAVGERSPPHYATDDCDSRGGRAGAERCPRASVLAALHAAASENSGADGGRATWSYRYACGKCAEGVERWLSRAELVPFRSPRHYANPEGLCAGNETAYFITSREALDLTHECSFREHAPTVLAYDCAIALCYCEEKEEEEKDEVEQEQGPEQQKQEGFGQGPERQQKQDELGQGPERQQKQDELGQGPERQHESEPQQEHKLKKAQEEEIEVVAMDADTLPHALLSESAALAYYRHTKLDDVLHALLHGELGDAVLNTGHDRWCLVQLLGRRAFGTANFRMPDYDSQEDRAWLDLLTAHTYVRKKRKIMLLQQAVHRERELALRQRQRQQEQQRQKREGQQEQQQQQQQEDAEEDPAGTGDDEGEVEAMRRFDDTIVEAMKRQDHEESRALVEGAMPMLFHNYALNMTRNHVATWNAFGMKPGGWCDGARTRHMYEAGLVDDDIMLLRRANEHLVAAEPETVDLRAAHSTHLDYLVAEASAVDEESPTAWATQILLGKE